MGADITPGYTFTEGEKNITAAKLNSATAGTVNSTFITTKSAVTPPGTYQVLLFDPVGGAFYKGTLNATVYASTNLIQNQSAVIDNPTNTYLLQWSAAQGNTRILESDFLTNVVLYIGSNLWDTGQFQFLSGVGHIKSGVLLTNALVYSGLTVQGGITNTNDVTFNLNSAVSVKQLRMYDYNSPVNTRAWMWYVTSNINASHFVLAAAADDFSTSGSVIDIVKTNTTATSMQFTANTISMSGAFSAGNSTISGTVTALGFGGWVYDSGTNVTWPGAGATITNAHGLGARPQFIRVCANCQTNDAATGWVVGDDVDTVSFVLQTTPNPFFQAWADATNVYVVRNSSGSTPVIIKKSNGTSTPITSVANWALHITAQVFH